MSNVVIRNVAVRTVAIDVIAMIVAVCTSVLTPDASRNLVS